MLFLSTVLFAMFCLLCVFCQPTSYHDLTSLSLVSRSSTRLPLLLHLLLPLLHPLLLLLLLLFRLTCRSMDNVLGSNCFMRKARRKLSCRPVKSSSLSSSSSANSHNSNWEISCQLRGIVERGCGALVFLSSSSSSSSPSSVEGRRRGFLHSNELRNRIVSCCSSWSLDARLTGFLASRELRKQVSVLLPREQDEDDNVLW